MGNTFVTTIALPTNTRMDIIGSEQMNLANAQINREYIIREVKTNNEELKNFLFTLGCYECEKVTVLSVLGDNYVISVKDARYSIDKDLAEAIIL